MRRWHKPVDDANDARTEHHSRATAGHLCCFFVCGICQMNRQQLVAQLSRPLTYDLAIVGGGATGLGVALDAAAREELDHLAWSEQRITELGGRTSLLNPLWYAGALAMGLVAGRLGDKWNLGFLAETEKQVEAHLQGHLSRLDERDAKTRAVVSAMRDDEAQHAATARSLGAAELPAPVKQAMRVAASVMTRVSYRI